MLVLYRRKWLRRPYSKRDNAPQLPAGLPAAGRSHAGGVERFLIIQGRLGVVVRHQQRVGPCGALLDHLCEFPRSQVHPASFTVDLPTSKKRWPDFVWLAYVML